MIVKAINLVEPLVAKIDGEVTSWTGNEKELTLLDASMIDEHVEHLQDTIYKCEEVLDTYMLVDEPKFINRVRKILESYDTITNDEGLVEDVTMDILEALGDDNETSRRTIS